jgi:chromatin structure-remodeling complex subunit RSC9
VSHVQQSAETNVANPAGTEGPNIYIRCLNALRSRIPAEQAYALNHLVKISYERGDKYRFDSFPGLAEGLVDKALEVGSLYYHVEWSVSWDMDASGDPSVLDGNNGTPDILERIASLMEKEVPDVLQTEVAADQLTLISEAVLTLRNMVTLPENAHNMSDFPPLKDLICIILSLPAKDTLAELKHLALDIAEALTPWLVMESNDPLYTVLVAQMDSTDRGIILTALRALGRISMNLDATNRLGDVPPSLLEHISSWLLLNDDELMDACLDFLYQYTAVVLNLDTMLRSITTENLIDHLVRLLSHGARKVQQHQVLVPEQRIQAVPSDIAPMPEDLLQEMLQLEEPDRVHRWVRSFFEEDPESFVTQLAAWQAYQTAFVGPLKTIGQALITPADFIRNSTSVYKDSNAQVLRDPNDAQQKFIIHGIRARSAPLSFEGNEYARCQWMANPLDKSTQCGKFYIQTESMWNHILTDHISATKNEQGQFDNVEKEYTCHWGDCVRYQRPTKLHLQEFARHINGHVSSALSAKRNGGAGGRRLSRSWVIPGRTMTLTYEETATVRDERNPAMPPQAAGIPLSAVLVLRNIARNVVKTEAEEELVKMRPLAKTDDERTGWNERLFRPVMPRLFEVLADNKALVSSVNLILPALRHNKLTTPNFGLPLSFVLSTCSS